MGGGRGTRPPTENQRERSRLGTARARQWVNLPLVALDLVVSQLRVCRRESLERVACRLCCTLCVDPWARAEQRVSRTAVRVLSHPPCHLCSALGLGYECAAVWFGGGSSEPPHGLYGPKTPIAIPTSHRSVTSLALHPRPYKAARILVRSRIGCASPGLFSATNRCLVRLLGGPKASMSGFAPNLPLPAPARHRLAHRLALPVGRTHACQHGVLLSREAECAMGCGSAPA